PAWFETSNLVAEQKFATSTDGTKIPYYLVHRKDMKLNGKNPTLLYGYGGFEIPLNPSYSATIRRAWLARGGVYAVANIRGGGEFGPKWHQAGLKIKRQIVYDDFISVAEDLIKTKVTDPQHLGIHGRSNGGLLMGVMFTQRPDLWKAVVIGVPLLDMRRFDKLLAGASWVGEYGDPDDKGAEGAFIRALSPYHNLRPEIKYPEPYIYTSTKDDRVHPGHARKFAKRLEDQGHPFLYYENIDGGHAGAANLEETARSQALIYAYLADKLMEGAGAREDK
ncbi:MAG TPA: S9 family peptidase, partial [Hellea balneolensis]|nr:S9 family peptidase [Hellea balneolensis]